MGGGGRERGGQEEGDDKRGDRRGEHQQGPRQVRGLGLTLGWFICYPAVKVKTTTMTKAFATMPMRKALDGMRNGGELESFECNTQGKTSQVGVATSCRHMTVQKRQFEPALPSVGWDFECQHCDPYVLCQ